MAPAFFLGGLAGIVVSLTDRKRREQTPEVAFELDELAAGHPVAWAAQSQSNPER